MKIETIIQWMGGTLAFVMLGFLLYSIWRGTQRQAGRTSGRNTGWLRSSLFYLTASAMFFWLS